MRGWLSGEVATWPFRRTGGSRHMYRSSLERTTPRATPRVPNSHARSEASGVVPVPRRTRAIHDLSGLW